jgi:hypothetical protein
MRKTEVELAKVDISVNKRGVGEKTETLKRRKIHSPICDPEHDETLRIVGVQLCLIPILRESQRQGKNAASKLIMHRPKVSNLVALKTPYWLSVAVLKVQRNTNSDIGMARSQRRVLGFGLY